MEASVLIVEDDHEIVATVRMFLQQEGFRVTHVADGQSALNTCAAGGWDLLLLDVMLPVVDGFEVCRKLRTQQFDAPILFLTARDEDAYQVLGLGLGADDYIMKPFSGVALVARIRAHIRRYRELRGAPAADTAAARVLQLGDRTVHLAGCTISDGGEETRLTAKECELLRFFHAHPGQVFTKDQLFQNVWGEKYYEGDDNTVLVHIRRLREKIEPDPSNPRFIVTVGRSLGYRFRPEGMQR